VGLKDISHRDILKCPMKSKILFVSYEKNQLSQIISKSTKDQKTYLILQLLHKEHCVS